jgi:FixJ family two-component response regulator
MPANQPLRLGIVDDDDGARTAVARLLRCLGHEVRSFESAEAIEAVDVAEMAFDCLVVDVRLPGVSGPELRDRLRGRGMVTPVVFITGDANVKARDAARTGGALTVVKPFDDDTLLAAIDAAIAASRGWDPPHVR